MISVLNFKPYDKGAMRGFFDLRYHGLSIKGCRLMSGNDGLWFSFPQVKSEKDGQVEYYDQLYLTPLEREHVRKLVILDLQQQGHLEAPKQAPRPEQPAKRPKSPGQDISEHMPGATQDDIPF